MFEKKLGGQYFGWENVHCEGRMAVHCRGRVIKKTSENVRNGLGSLPHDRGAMMGEG